MLKSRRLLKFANGRRLATYLIALWKLARHDRTPRAAKIAAWAVIAYAVSPIDLIPDFIPVLGQLDDLIIVPLGVALVVRLTPTSLWQECVTQARLRAERLPSVWWGAAAIVVFWVAVFAALAWLIWRAAGG